MVSPDSEECPRRAQASLPPPRANLTRFHGVFAPGAKLRPFLVPQAGAEEASARLEVAARKERTPRVNWAELLRRTFDLVVFPQTAASSVRASSSPGSARACVRRPPALAPRGGGVTVEPGREIEGLRPWRLDLLRFQPRSQPSEPSSATAGGALTPVFTSTSSEPSGRLMNAKAARRSRSAFSGFHSFGMAVASSASNQRRAVQAFCPPSSRCRSSPG